MEVLKALHILLVGFLIGVVWESVLVALLPKYSMDNGLRDAQGQLQITAH